jgi:hypothetical protein
MRVDVTHMVRTVFLGVGGGGVIVSRHVALSSVTAPTKDAVGSSEPPVRTYQTGRRHIPDDIKLRSDGRVSLRRLTHRLKCVVKLLTWLTIADTR